jgi:hypothetical protein
MHNLALSLAEIIKRKADFGFLKSNPTVMSRLRASRDVLKRTLKTDTGLVYREIKPLSFWGPCVVR